MNEQILQKWVMGQRWLVKAIKVFLRTAPGEAKFSIVGGAVRDALLGQTKPKDIDILVSDSCEEDIEEMLQLMLARRQIKGFKRVGQSFPVFKVEFVGLKDPIDLALARREVSTGSAHTAFRYESEYVSASEDSNRRDFTINAIYCGLSLVDGKIKVSVKDYHGGLADLADGRIQCVGNAADRFKEDPLRILRAIRFGAQMPSCRINTHTYANMAFRAHLLGTVSLERVHHEYIKAASHQFTDTLQVYCDLELFDTIFSPMGGYDAFPERENFVSGTFQAVPEELVWPLTVLSCKNSDWGNMDHQIKTLSRVKSPQEKRSVAILNGLSKLVTRTVSFFPDVYLEEVRQSRYGKHIEDLYSLLKVPHCWEDLPRVNPYLPEPLTGEHLKSWGIAPSPSYKFLLRGMRAFQINGINDEKKFKKWAIDQEVKKGRAVKTVKQLSKVRQNNECEAVLHPTIAAILGGFCGH